MERRGNAVKSWSKERCISIYLYLYTGGDVTSPNEIFDDTAPRQYFIPSRENTELGSCRLPNIKVKLLCKIGNSILQIFEGINKF